MGIESEERYLYDWPELGSALPDEKVLQRLHSDVRGVLDRFPKKVYERNKTRAEHSPFIDDWGNGQMEIEPDNWYPGIDPMPEAKTIEDLDAYTWPDMDDPYRTSHVREQALKLDRENQYAILATPWLMFPFERAIGLQGMEKFLFNMATEPEFAQEY